MKHSKVQLNPIQSTPVISRLLGAKIRERELSGSPVISRCREKATTREFRITDPHSGHTPKRLQLATRMLSDNRGTYVSPISTRTDIAPAKNHNKPHLILIIMQQNCQITRCARQHTMDSVLKSTKLRRDLTGNRNGFTHARSALRDRVSPNLDELLGEKFANLISNKILTFSTQ